MTTDDMSVIQNIICDKAESCKECLLSEKIDCCFGSFSSDDESIFLRVIPSAMELTDSPALKKYLAGLLKAEVV